MSIIYKLSDHQLHPHLKFAIFDGNHHCDFADHKHDFSEMFLVTEGSGIHSVASHRYNIKKGDVFIINGDIEHGFSNVDNLSLINLMFDAPVPFFEQPSMRSLAGYQAMFKVEPIARQTSDYQAKLTLDDEQLPTVRDLLEEIRTEYNQGKAGFETMVTSLMQQLVVLLSRLYQGQESSKPQTTLALSRALVHIEKHLTQPELNSESIANAAFVSKRQLERLFRQFLDTSPTQYIRDAQLNKAKILLLSNSALSIQAVADMSGFTDSNYFSKCFKTRFEMSPKAFRNQALHECL